MSLLVTPGYAPRRRAYSLDTKPTSPHAYDDEFDVSSLDAKWTRTTTLSFDDSTAIDPYSGFTSGHRSSINSYRKSWYMWQPSNTTFARVYQSVTLPTDCFVWARFSFNCRYSAVVNNDASVSIGFHANAAGVPSANDNVYLYLNEADTDVVQVQAGRTTGGADSSTVTKDVGPQSVGTDSLSQVACYVGIQKISTTWNYWVGWPNGHWIFCASQTQASTMAFLALTFLNGSTASPGNMIIGCDFVRFLSGRYLP